MTKEDLINQITEEIKVGAELGHEYEYTAKNIVAIFDGSREHIDYDSGARMYEWERP